MLLLHNLSDAQFEDLVIEFCRELLGDGIQGFASGPDGGRDARFSGTAVVYPDKIIPWSGNFIIQAKHTEITGRKFSEPDFNGSAPSSTIGKELPKIKKLIAEGELEFYFFFANRRCSANTDARIRKLISDETGLDKDRIRLFDQEEINRLAQRYPQAVINAHLNPAESPADYDPDDIAEVITALAEYHDEISDLMEGEEPPPENRTTPAEKNDAHGMSEHYFVAQIRPAMAEFATIRRFLAHPTNAPLVKLYEESAAELEAKLVAWTDAGNPYERLLESMLTKIAGRDYDLKSNKRLFRTVIYYMYCNCDIAKIIKT